MVSDALCMFMHNTEDINTNVSSVQFKYTHVLLSFTLSNNSATMVHSKYTNK